VLGLCLTAGPVVAQQRPLLTEDPETIGEGLILLETGIDHAWAQTFTVSGLEGNVLRGPLLGFSFGMGSNAEIQIDGVSVSRLRISNRFDAPLSNLVDVSGDTTRSFDDIVVGAKVKIVSEGARMPAIALRFATRLPNASNESGLGLDTIDFFQSILVGKTMQSVRVVGNIGLGILSDPTRGDRQNDLVCLRSNDARTDIRLHADAPRRRRDRGFLVARRYPAGDHVGRHLCAGESRIFSGCGIGEAHSSLFAP